MNDRLQGWDWAVTCYHADDVEPPKTPRGLAIETVHKGESSRDMEIRAARSRADIGRIVVSPLSNRARKLWADDEARRTAS